MNVEKLLNGADRTCDLCGCGCQGGCRGNHSLVTPTTHKCTNIELVDHPLITVQTKFNAGLIMKPSQKYFLINKKHNFGQ